MSKHIFLLSSTPNWIPIYLLGKYYICRKWDISWCISRGIYDHLSFIGMKKGCGNGELEREREKEREKERERETERERDEGGRE